MSPFLVLSIANVNPADDGQPMKQHNVEVGVEVRMTLWKKARTIDHDVLYTLNVFLRSSNIGLNLYFSH